MTDLQVGQLEQVEKTLIPVEGSKSYSQILAHVESSFSTCKQNRLQFEKQWYLNIAFYFGKQYVDWVGQYGTPTSRMIVPPAPKWRVRLVSNQIRRYVRKEHAKAIREEPTGFVLPSSGEESDLLAAKAADAILEYLFRELNYFKELKRAVFWANLCGNGFIKDWYARSGDEDNGKDLPGLEKVTPFHMYVPDVVQEDMEAQPYVIHAGTKSIEFAENTYGITIPRSNSSSAPTEEKFLQAMGIVDKLERDQVYIKEAWFKPGASKLFKEGAVVVWADNKILYLSEGWPYEHGQFPFTKIDHIPTGRFYNESIITDLIPLQKEYNKARSQIIEAKNKMASPQLTAQQGSIDPNKLTSEPGSIIFYKPGFERPQQMDLKPLPNYVLEELNRTLFDADNISSQHEVSRGQVPPGIEAATAISYLQEQDDSVLSELTNSIEDATERIGTHLLMHVDKNWDEARKIQVVGADRQLEVFEFSKADIAGNTNFHVQHGSATPRSQAGKQAFILDLMKNGFLRPETGLKYLDMAETGKMYEEMQTDTRQAQRENLKMSQGIGLPEPQVERNPLTGEETETVVDIQTLVQDKNFIGFPTNTYDNHIVHIIEHDNWRKRQEFESCPPEIKYLFELHDRTHKQMLVLLYGMPPPNTGDPNLDTIMLNSLVYRIMNGMPIDGMGGVEDTQGEEGQEEETV